jgi:hypothetical protein
MQERSPKSNPFNNRVLGGFSTNYQQKISPACSIVKTELGVLISSIKKRHSSFLIMQ